MSASTVMNVATAKLIELIEARLKPAIVRAEQTGEAKKQQQVEELEQQIKNENTNHELRVKELQDKLAVVNARSASEFATLDPQSVWARNYLSVLAISTDETVSIDPSSNFSAWLNGSGSY